MSFKIEKNKKEWVIGLRIDKFKPMIFLRSLENSATPLGWWDRGSPLPVFHRAHGFIVWNAMPAEAVMPTFPI